MRPQKPSRTAATQPIEWRDLPPKVRNQASAVRPDQVAAGMKIRRMLEQDRRNRGIPPEGIIFPGDDIATPAPGEDERFEHGTSYTYVKYGCRCDECKAGHSTSGKTWRENRMSRSQ